MNLSTFDTRMSRHQKFVEISVNDSPILRRASSTEAVISVLLDESGLCHISCGDPVQDSYSSFNFNILSIKALGQWQLEDFSESPEKEMRIAQEEEQTRCQRVRRVEARRQRGHVYKNAKIILNDDEKFRQFKREIKKTGMLTSGGVRQVLFSPTVDNR
jgi:hypothetical protein